ncbi:hypothetical protein INR49_031748, partial [Caranx melampygus]
MNTSLKHWREAATLILAAGHRLGADGLSSRTPPVTAAPGCTPGRSHLPHRSAFDYQVLLLKRSSKSGFMPNAYVFPGGMVDSSDFSSEWLDIFKSFRNSPSFGLRSVKQPADTRPPIFATDRLKLGSPIPGEVAFRICALRETFEESGVLLAVSKQEERSLLTSLEDRCAATGPVLHYKVNELGGSELTRWRALVNQNPSNFIRMCRELEVLPNIWALHEWGNWLTPVGRYGVTRFDTAFFICCLQETPDTLQDEKEIVRFQWSTPSEVLQSYQARQLWIAPPQFYELSRMCRFPLLKDLHNFSSQRATEGCEQWLPVLFSKDEHHISVLPGDKLYPSDTSGKTQVDTSIDCQLDDPQDNSALHRIVMSNPYSTTLQVTITPRYKHLLPVLEPALSHDSKMCQSCGFLWRSWERMEMTPTEEFPTLMLDLSSAPASCFASTAHGATCTFISISSIIWLTWEISDCRSRRSAVSMLLSASYFMFCTLMARAATVLVLPVIPVWMRCLVGTLRGKSCPISRDRFMSTSRSSMLLENSTHRRSYSARSSLLMDLSFNREVSLVLLATASSWAFLRVLFSSSRRFCESE